MSRLPGFGPCLLAGLAILISTAACSSRSAGAAGTGGSATAGGSGGLGGGGNGGGAGTGGSAPSNGGASGTGGAVSAGAGGTTGGASAGTAGSAGTTGAAGAGGTTASAGAGGNGATTGSAGAGGTAGTGTGCLGNNIDLRATTVSGTVTVNGAAITDPTTKGAGSLSLRSADDSALLGTTSPAGGSYAALVFPGTYDLYYGHSADGTAVPNNALAKLQSGIVVGASPLKLDVNVPATKVSGTVTVNGGAVPNTSDAGLGTVSLVNTAGDSVVLASTPPGGSYSVLVVPGTYDLYYSGVAFGPLLPTNTFAKVQSGIVVGTSPLSLNVDVPTRTVSATITINGAAVTGAAKGQWTLTLKNAAGDSAQLTTYASTTGVYSGRVVPGTYDLYWTGSTADVPGNTSAKIQSGIVVGTSAVSLSVDVPSTTMSGSATVAGAVSSALGSGITYLNLRSATGDSVPLTITTTGTYSARVIPGTYDLYFGTAAAPLNGPARNTSAKIRSGIVVGTSALSLNIDIPTTTLSGTATLNGAAITTSAQKAFVFTLQGAAGDRAQIAAYPQGGAFSASVVPGTYDLYYTRQGDIGLEIPNNIFTKIRSGLAVGASPVALDVDIRGTTVSGAITVNGVATAGAAGDLAFVALSDGVSNISDSSALLASAASTTGTYSTFVLPGRYELYYVLYRSSGSTLPTNTNTHLGCFIVP